MSNAYSAGIQANLTSPQRKEAAIHAVEDDEGLSDTELVGVANKFRKDTGLADTYLALKRPSARTKFVEDMLYNDN